MASVSINDLVENLKVSRGFVIFVSYLVQDEKGDVQLEHRYIRQQLPPEDLEMSLKNFKEFAIKDVSDSSSEMLRVAEMIKNQKFAE